MNIQEVLIHLADPCLPRGLTLRDMQENARFMSVDDEVTAGVVCRLNGDIEIWDLRESAMDPTLLRVVRITDPTQEVEFPKCHWFSWQWIGRPPKLAGKRYWRPTYTRMANVAELRIYPFLLRWRMPYLPHVAYQKGYDAGYRETWEKMRDAKREARELRTPSKN